MSNDHSDNVDPPPELLLSYIFCLAFLSYRDVPVVLTWGKHTCLGPDVNEDIYNSSPSSVLFAWI